VGLLYGVRTLDARDDFNNVPTTATRDGFDRERTIANGAFAAAGASVLAGVVLWLVLPRDRAASSRTGLFRSAPVRF
jgi:hypothetical protein